MVGKRVLAIDLGASSGRGIVFESDGKSVDYEEVHRFDNNCIDEDGTLRWDIDMLYREIVMCIKACRDRDIKIDSIGIDTWGVDYGVIGADGSLMGRPYCYRDSRTKGMIDDERLFSKREMYDMAGIALGEFNTSYQLIAEQRTRKLSRDDKILFIPYLLAYMLTNEMTADISFASSTAFYDGKKYDDKFLDKIGLCQDNFPPVKNVGDEIGYVKREILDSIGIDYDIKVLVTCGHDTASAIITVMEKDKSPLYISSGTWSLFGTILDEPIINDKSYANNYTNERGFGGQVTFLKNIMGMWIIQECRRDFNKTNNYTWQDIQDLSHEGEEFKAFINVEDSSFSPPHDMVDRIKHYVYATQNTVIDGVSEIARCVYESLAMEYRYALNGLKNITGNSYSRLYIIGGGTKNVTLNQMVADALDIEVVGGCVEATAIGNALSQFYGLSLVHDVDEMQSLARLCYTPTIFKPDKEKTKSWDRAYERYMALKR